MFQTPKFLKETGKGALSFSNKTKINVEKCAYIEYIIGKINELSAKSSMDGAEPIESISFSLGIPDEVKNEISREIVGNDEEYVLSLGKKSEVYAKTSNGFLRALSTILQLSDEGELRELLIYDYPASPERGYRVYMPGRKTMGDFLKMIDFLVYYNYNALILEVGGAM